MAELKGLQTAVWSAAGSHTSSSIPKRSILLNVIDSDLDDGIECKCWGITKLEGVSGIPGSCAAIVKHPDRLTNRLTGILWTSAKLIANPTTSICQWPEGWKIALQRSSLVETTSNTFQQCVLVLKKATGLHWKSIGSRLGEVLLGFGETVSCILCPRFLKMRETWTYKEAHQRTINMINKTGSSVIQHETEWGVSV